MASNAAKVKRRAVALNELARLSALIAEHLEVEVPDVRPANRDPEMAQIERIESINDLLGKVLTASGIDPVPPKEDEFAGMTKAQLIETATERGIPVNKSMTKAELIELIENFDAAN